VVVLRTLEADAEGPTTHGLDLPFPWAVGYPQLFVSRPGQLQECFGS
jgi:hypothetical protein